VAVQGLPACGDCEFSCADFKGGREMKLEERVVGLELAKKMEELGFKQESLWYWVHIVRDDGTDRWDLVIKNNAEFMAKEWKYEIVSAFTVAELGEMLPYGVTSFKFGLNDWRIWTDVNKTNFEQSETEANARAKMLIYLKERGI